jgi:Right handed beta helix region
MQNVAIRQGAGVLVGAAAHIKFINLIVHDLEGGFLIPPEAEGIEVYGNIIYFNGWQRADGVGEGHGIWTPSQAQQRLIRDNIVFDQFSHGIQSYGNHMDNLFIEGNVVFNSGAVAKFLDRNIMVSGGSTNLMLRQNMTYYTAGPAAPGEGVNLGMGGDCKDARVLENYLTGSNPLNLTGCRPVEMKGNTLHGRFDGTYAKQFPGNQYMMPKEPPLPTMSGQKVMVRPNQYEPGRANVVVYNWDRLPSINVDISNAGLKASDQFELRNARDILGAPVVSGTYAGGSISVPMRDLTIAKPIGVVTNPPQQTAPEFAVFVLRKTIQPEPVRSTATTSK